MDKAVSQWMTNIDLAAPYLVNRGIGPKAAEHFRLGVVACAEPPFERYVNRLAIPYVDRLGPVGLQFRCIDSHDCKSVECKKYLQMDDQKLGLFNVLSLDSDAEIAHLCEGELDAITLAQLVDDPVVAIAGASKWMPHFPYHFTGFDRVVVWADGDDAGKAMRKTIRERVANADIVQMPVGEDVNSLFCWKGPEAIRAMYLEEVDE
jgi:DNA primase